jgi:hypothetical protein
MNNSILTLESPLFPQTPAPIEYYYPASLSMVSKSYFGNTMQDKFINGYMDFWMKVNDGAIEHSWELAKIATVDNILGQYNNPGKEVSIGMAFYSTPANTMAELNGGAQEVSGY